MNFAKIHVFPYSKRTGTPAAAREDQLDETFVKEQFDRVLSTVQDVAKARNGYLVGSRQTALVEEINAHDDSMVTGRLSNNSMVHFKGDESMIGTLVDVDIKEAKGFYYIGELV